MCAVQGNVQRFEPINVLHACTNQNLPTAVLGVTPRLAARGSPQMLNHQSHRHDAIRHLPKLLPVQPLEHAGAHQQR